MTDTLLRELSNSDLDWMINSGQRHTLTPGALLDLAIHQDFVYVIIEGNFSLEIVLQGDPQEQLAIDDLNQGELLGAGVLLDVSETVIARALEPSMVLSLPVAKVQEKLSADVAFAAHFYRAIAVMLSNRLRRIFEHPNRIQFWGEHSAKEVLSVFGELRDSDVDWLVSFGGTEIIPADKVLLQAGRPVDALYIVLEGQMAISAPQQGSFNPLYLCFSGLAESTRDQKAFTFLSKGGMPGIISFLDFRPLPVTIRTITESLVFAVPRQTLATKLQVDPSFASRFYRVVAIQVLELLQTVSTRLVDPEALGSMAEDLLDEELDLADLQHMSEGAKKFNWMLAQLGMVHHG